MCGPRSFCLGSCHTKRSSKPGGLINHSGEVSLNKRQTKLLLADALGSHNKKAIDFVVEITSVVVNYDDDDDVEADD